MSQLTIEQVQNHKHNLEAQISLLLNEFHSMTNCRISDVALHAFDVTSMVDTLPHEQYSARLEIKI